MLFPVFVRWFGGASVLSCAEKKTVETEMLVIALTINRAVRRSQWLAPSFNIAQKDCLEKIEALVMSGYSRSVGDTMTVVQYFYEIPPNYSMHGIFNDFLAHAIQYCAEVLRDPQKAFEETRKELALQPPYIRFEPAKDGVLAVAGQLQDATTKKQAFDNVAHSELTAAVDVVLVPLLLSAHGVLRLARKEHHDVKPALQQLGAAKHLLGPFAQAILKGIEERQRE